MGTISEKLVYLNGTKQAIKQAINEDFEVIDDNTTFREYAEEISSNNAKYKDLIPKETTNATNTLDISNSSGLDKALVTQYGNTYQETTTGKQLFDIQNEPIAQNTLSEAGISVIINNNGTITASGTKTSDYKFIRYEIELEAGTYYFSGCPSGGSNNGYSSIVQTTPTASSQIFDTGNGATFTLTQKTTIYYFPIRVATGEVTFNNTIFKPMIAKVPVSYDDYEPYTNGASPNPDYPQEIVNISGKSTLKDVGKNLFDVTTIRNAINGSILNNTIISNAISTSYGGVSANITGITLSPGAYYLSLKAKIDSGSASALNKITLVGINNDEVTEIEKPTISSSYQIYVIQITINETKTITNIGVQLGYTNTNAVVSYKDIMISKYSDTTYEPYKEQSFDLDLKSKNLLDLSKFVSITTNSGITLINDTTTGKITLNGTATKNTFITYSTEMFDLGDIVSLSANNSTINGNVAIRMYDISSAETTQNIELDTINKTSNGIILSRSFDGFQIRITSGTTLNDFELYPQLEKNSTSTNFEPYYDINLCKIEDYKDRIYPLNGKWYLEKKIGKVVLNGSEDWQSYINEYKHVLTFRFRFADIKSANQIYLLSNYFKNVTDDDAANGEFKNRYNNYYNLEFVYTDITSVTDFKTWLSTHNTTVYYILNTPTTEEITESNYPTLYNQLNNIKLFEGVNHITMTNESGLDVEFDITYYKDWKLD